MERGIRYFSCFEPQINPSILEGKETKPRSHHRTPDILLRGGAPFRGQMFISADLDDGQTAEFVLKSDLIMQLLGTNLLPRRPHSAPRQKQAALPERLKSSGNANCGN